MKTTLKPIHSKIVVSRIEADERTAGGLYIPDQAKEKPTQAVVLAAGPGRILDNGQRAPMSVKAGDKVLFGKYNGTEIELNGEKVVLVLDEDDILAVIGA